MTDAKDRARRWEESLLVDMMSTLRRTEDPEILDGVRANLNDFIHQQTIDRYLTERGYQTSPLAKLYLQLWLTPLGLHKESDDHTRRVLALRRNITPILHEHVQTRRAWGGNIVFEWTGPTGMGKSSCMLGFMERHNGLRDTVLSEGTEGLRRHIAIDINSLPAKIAPLKAGQAVGMDEQLHLTGEGARNLADTLANLEETLRGTGIDIHFASPSLREHTTSQGVLEALAWNREKQRTMFLVKLAMMGEREPMPLGTVILPWCSKETYAAYEPIKRENLERTRRMQFNQASDTRDELIRHFFETPSIQVRFKYLVAKPADVARWWREVMPATGLNESDSYAATCIDMLRLARVGGTAFREAYGWDPTPAILAAAKRKTTTSSSTGRTTW